MTKLDFLLALQEKLSGFPGDEVKERLHFYNESIEDRMEEGLTEEEAVAQMGSVDEIAQQIIGELPLTQPAKERLSSRKTALLLLGSPIWLSLLISAVSVVLSVYVSLWAVVGSLWGVFASLAVSGTACVMAFPIIAMQDYFYSGLLSFGAGLFVLDLAIFAFFGCHYATKGIVFLTKKMVLLIKRAFVRKEAVE